MKMTMRAVGLAALLATGFAAGVNAQQPAAPAPAAPAQPAISPSHLAAARALALQMKFDDPIKAVLDEMQLQVLATFTQTRPELANDLKQVLVSMNPDIAAKREEIIDVGARAFAKRFSEAEIAELMKFLQSPIGIKYTREQPEAINEYFGQIQPWIGALNQFVIEKVRAEMKKKGHDL
ncbi:DUF2059 domain-containing protein [Terrarubrum flagellatum]|uniref:DUF2059 domain-containing protein n=1 Tax=Terrirubrum flagellatum TaxID=2895980 RepID=UPI0031454C41